MEVALERAMQVFWQKGYEGASLSDLTDAMGINRPSLYAAFGNKEELFRKALERYLEGPAFYSHGALEAPTARGVVEAMLKGAINLQTDARRPHGCLLVQSALVCGDDALPVRKELVARRREGEAALRKRFERAKGEGDLSPDSDPAALARYVASLVYGLAVQAAGGATRKDLEKVAEIALSGWPS